MAQNEMRAMRGMPQSVRLSEGLGGARRLAMLDGNARKHAPEVAVNAAACRSCRANRRILGLHSRLGRLRSTARLRAGNSWLRLAARETSLQHHPWPTADAWQHHWALAQAAAASPRRRRTEWSSQSR